MVECLPSKQNVDGSSPFRCFRLTVKKMNRTKFEKLISVALPTSLEIPRPKKHVSIIIRKNEIVAMGTNNFRTHPQAKKYGYFFDEVHSELDALLRYKGQRDNLKLVNYRFNRFGNMRMSKPCCKCLPWCVALFDNIWYSTNTGMVNLKETKHV